MSETFQLFVFVIINQVKWQKNTFEHNLSRIGEISIKSAREEVLLAAFLQQALITFLPSHQETYWAVRHLCCIWKACESDCWHLQRNLWRQQIPCLQHICWVVDDCLSGLHSCMVECCNKGTAVAKKSLVRNNIKVVPVSTLECCQRKLLIVRLFHEADF